MNEGNMKAFQVVLAVQRPVRLNDEVAVIFGTQHVFIKGKPGKPVHDLLPIDVVRGITKGGKKPFSPSGQGQGMQVVRR